MLEVVVVVADVVPVAAPPPVNESVIPVVLVAVAPVAAVPADPIVSENCGVPADEFAGLVAFDPPVDVPSVSDHKVGPPEPLVKGSLETPISMPEDDVCAHAGAEAPIDRAIKQAKMTFFIVNPFLGRSTKN